MEEALYLAHHGAAEIRVNGLAQSFEQLYALLTQVFKVSLFKFAVFSHMVHAGYILCRPQVPTGFEDVGEGGSQQYSVSVSPFQFSVLFFVTQ
jgi:hypothetical protein